MTPRPPIVVVLGHVDHGKSSLLEAIREEFKITSRESGGITQHIGAYVAEYNGKKITFIDTPGHEAFSAMRSRGAKVADLAILVVAADEGIQPQTKEAIQVIKAAEIPFVVALNKIDKPQADPERVKGELGKYEVFVEGLGGQVPALGVSATTKQGIKELLEMILLMADLENLQTNPAKPAKGVIIESSVDAQRGVAASLLVLDGSLKVGNVVATQSSLGKVRMIEDFRGEPFEEIAAGLPARVFGFEQNPAVGEAFKVFENESLAKEYVALQEKTETKREVAQEPGKKTLNLVLKADVAGSLEVLESMLLALPQENVMVKLVAFGLGEISDGDVRLAQTSKAAIIGFRVKTNQSSENLARRENILIEHFDVIYDLIQRVRTMMEHVSIEKEPVRKDLGQLRVLAVFFTEKNRQIVGGRVLEGEAQRGAFLEVVRNDAVAGKGKVMGLQKDKKEVQTVSAGQECGISYEGDVEVAMGDILRFYVFEKAVLV